MCAIKTDWLHIHIHLRTLFLSLQVGVENQNLIKNVNFVEMEEDKSEALNT